MLNNFNKIFMKNFLSENILSHCFLSEMFFQGPKLNFFGDKIYFTCWSRLLKIFIEIATLQTRPQFLSH